MPYKFNKRLDKTEFLYYSKELSFVFVPRKVSYSYDFWNGNKNKSDRTFMYEGEIVTQCLGDLRNEVMEKLEKGQIIEAVNLFDGNRNVFKF